jgi:hypothetical protein
MYTQYAPTDEERHAFFLTQLEMPTEHIELHGHDDPHAFNTMFLRVDPWQYGMKYVDLMSLRLAKDVVGSLTKEFNPDSLFGQEA